MDNINHCSTTQTPYLCFNQGSKAAVFVHGNGLPPGCYRELLQQLDDYRVLAPFLRPCWPDQQPDARDEWQRLTEDLLAFIDAQQSTVSGPRVAIGHSTGAVLLLMAALRKPQLFDKLVFIEPIFLPWHWVLLSRCMPPRLRRQLPRLKKIRNKTEHWSCLQHIFDEYRHKNTFRLLSDPALWQLIRGCSYQTEDGWRLRYATAWEAHFYHHLPHTWRWLRQLELPVLAIRAGRSPYLTAGSWEKWKKLQPDTQFAEFNQQDHLLPLVLPQEVADTMLEFLEN